MSSLIVDQQRRSLLKRLLASVRTALGWSAKRLRIQGVERVVRASIPQDRFTLDEAPETAGHIASALTLSDEKRVDVLISLLGILHENIVTWTTRAHEAVTWAVGITFGVVSFVFVSPEKVSLWSAIVISIGLLLFGLMVHMYVRTARRAYNGNRLAISKCEAALRLYDEGAYLDPQAFFTFSKAMQASQTLRVLSEVHVAATIGAVIFIICRVLFK